MKFSKARSAIEVKPSTNLKSIWVITPVASLEANLSIPVIGSFVVEIYLGITIVVMDLLIIWALPFKLNPVIVLPEYVKKSGSVNYFRADNLEVNEYQMSMFVQEKGA